MFYWGVPVNIGYVFRLGTKTRSGATYVRSPKYTHANSVSGDLIRSVNHRYAHIILERIAIDFSRHDTEWLLETPHSLHAHLLGNGSFASSRDQWQLEMMQRLALPVPGLQF